MEFKGSKKVKNQDPFLTDSSMIPGLVRCFKSPRGLEGCLGYLPTQQ